MVSQVMMPHHLCTVESVVNTRITLHNRQALAALIAKGILKKMSGKTMTTTACLKWSNRKSFTLA